MRNSASSYAPPPATGISRSSGSQRTPACAATNSSGLKWTDIDFRKGRLALNRGLVAVGYEVHETRGKTKTARRNIALDTTTVAVLDGWRAMQQAEFAAVGIDNAEQWVCTNGDGTTVHPHAVREAFNRIVNNASVRRIRFHDLRHTHGS